MNIKNTFIYSIKDFIYLLDSKSKNKFNFFLPT